MEKVAVAPAWTLARLLDGFVTTQLLYVAAKLGVADVLADGPRTGAEIADAVGADRDALVRVLRGLVTDDVLAEEADGRFALTPVGECLRSGPGAALARGEVYYEAAAGLLDTVRKGGTAFEHVHGERFFDHLARHPDREAAFQGSMAARSEQEAHDVAAAYDFSGLRRLVDVGGGRGILLAAHPSRQPGPARGPHRSRGGDPRRPSSSGRRIGRRSCGLHRRRLLHHRPRRRRRLHAVASHPRLGRRRCPAHPEHLSRGHGRCPASRLLVVEAILPERAHDRPAAIRMDIHMLLLLGARERTEAEFRALLGSTGFQVQRVVMTPSPAGLGVIEAIPV